MKEFVIQNADVLLDDFAFHKRCVTVRNGKFAEISSLPPEGAEVIDASGLRLIPGLVETHFHGAQGATFQYPDRPGVDRVSSYEASMGVTSMFPTVSSGTVEVIQNAVRTIREAAEAGTPGAKIRGIHLEGPFLSKEFRGSHAIEDLYPPTLERLDAYCEAGGEWIRILTIAPELEGAEEVIRAARDRNITVEIGHSGADYETAIKAIDLGASVSTHTFNAMRPLRHRDPGILGAVLTDGRLTCEVICDLRHVQEPVVRLVYQAKGPDRMSIVSDSMYAAGLPEGSYNSDGRIRIVKDGLAYIENGTISGSACTSMHGFRNLIRMGIPMEEVSKMASRTPARTSGIFDRTGSITVGKDADFILLNPSLEVISTYVEGVCVFSGGNQ